MKRLLLAHPINTTRWVKKIAWAPMHIDGYSIWFEYYYELQEYDKYGYGNDPYAWSVRMRTLTVPKAQLSTLIPPK